MSDSESDGMASQQQHHRIDESGIAQPQYGQRKVPEYGAMMNQFSAGYNPYVFGKPESDNDQKTGDADGNRQKGASSSARDYAYGANGHPLNSALPYRHNQNNSNEPPVQQQGGLGPQNGQDGGRRPNGFQHPGAPGFNGFPQNQRGWGGDVQHGPHEPDIVNGVDMNDPQQNPLWGHWSALAVASFLCSLWNFEFSLVWLIMGLLAVRRTKVYHMRGRGLAIAAIVISILALIFQVWLLLHPDAVQGLLGSLYSMMGGSGTGSSGGNPLTA